MKINQIMSTQNNFIFFAVKDATRMLEKLTPVVILYFTSSFFPPEASLKLMFIALGIELQVQKLGTNSS